MENAADRKNRSISCAPHHLRVEIWKQTRRRRGPTPTPHLLDTSIHIVLADGLILDTYVLEGNNQGTDCLGCTMDIVGVSFVCDRVARGRPSLGDKCDSKQLRQEVKERGIFWLALVPGSNS